MNIFKRMSIEVSSMKGQKRKDNYYSDNVNNESIYLIYDGFLSYVAFKYGIKDFNNLDYFLDSVEREINKLCDKYEDYTKLPPTNFESDRLKLGNAHIGVKKDVKYYAVDISGSIDDLKELLDLVIIGQLTDTKTTVDSENGEVEVKDFTGFSYATFLERLNNMRNYLRKEYVYSKSVSIFETSTYKWLSEFNNLLED